MGIPVSQSSQEATIKFSVWRWCSWWSFTKTWFWFDFAASYCSFSRSLNCSFKQSLKQKKLQFLVEFFSILFLGIWFFRWACQTKEACSGYAWEIHIPIKNGHMIFWDLYDLWWFWRLYSCYSFFQHRTRGGEQFICLNQLRASKFLIAMFVFCEPLYDSSYKSCQNLPGLSFTFLGFNWH